MKKCLIVVDYQNDFVIGSLGFKQAEMIKPQIINKINQYHQENNQVIFTLDTHQVNYKNTMEGKYLPVEHCIKKTIGHQLVMEVLSQTNTNDLFFEKETFPSLDLANYLKDNPFEEVELCGVVSNICVISNAIMVKAALPNARIIIDSKAIASSNQKLEQEAVDILKNLHIEVY